MDPSSVFSEVKERLPARQVLERFLGPSRGSFRCPFHPDKVPSFSPHGPAIVCFGCQWRGDIFRFVEDHLKVSRGEALRILADMAGVTLPERSTDARRRLPSLAESIRQVRRETDRIERDILAQTERAAAQAWRRAWAERQAERVWQTVTIGAALDRQVELLRMKRCAG